MNRVFVRNLSKVTNQIYLHPSNKLTFTTNENSLSIGSLKVPEFKRENFVPNPEFLPILHSIIADRIHEDFLFIMEASVNGNSYMPIYDFRDVPRYGRIPEIDNVFGYLQVSPEGQMIKGTYQANDMYQVFNKDGITTLSDFLLEEIQKVD